MSTSPVNSTTNSSTYMDRIRDWGAAYFSNSTDRAFQVANVLLTKLSNTVSTTQLDLLKEITLNIKDPKTKEELFTNCFNLYQKYLPHEFYATLKSKDLYDKKPPKEGELSGDETEFEPGVKVEKENPENIKKFNELGLLIELASIKKTSGLQTPNLNVLMIELQRTIRDAKTREMISILVSLMDMIATDPQCQNAIIEGFKTPNGLTVTQEKINLLFKNAPQTAKFKHFFVEINAILTNDIWNHILKGSRESPIPLEEKSNSDTTTTLPEETSLTKFKNITLSLKRNLESYNANSTAELNESWDAAEANCLEEISEIGKNIKGILNDLMDAEIIARSVRYLPYKLLKPLIPAETAPPIKHSIEFFLQVFESNSTNVELEFLIKPLLKVFLDTNVQVMLQKHATTDFKAAYKEVRLIGNGSTVPAPVLNALGKDFIMLMTNPESRQAISDLVQTLQMIFTHRKLENYTKQIESNIKTPEAKASLTALLEATRLPKDFLRDHLTPFLVDNLWNCFAKAESMSGEFRKMGSQLTSWMIDFNPDESSFAEIDVATSAKIREEIAMINRFAKKGLLAFSLELGSKATQQNPEANGTINRSLVDKVFTLIPTETLGAITYFLEKSGKMVTDAYYKKVIVLVQQGLIVLTDLEKENTARVKIERSKENQGITTFIGPLTKVVLNTAIFDAIKEASTLSKTFILDAIDEALKIKNKKDDGSPILDKLAKAFDRILRDETSQKDLLALLKHLLALLEGSGLRLAGKKVLDQKAFKDFSASFTDFLFTLAGFPPTEETEPLLTQINHFLKEWLRREDNASQLVIVLDQLINIVGDYQFYKLPTDPDWKPNQSEEAKESIAKIVSAFQTIIQSSNEYTLSVIRSSRTDLPALPTERYREMLRTGDLGFEGCVELAKISRAFTEQILSHSMEYSPSLSATLNNAFWGDSLKVIYAEEKAFVGDTVENAYLKALTTLKNRLETAQKKPDFMVHLVIDLMKEFKTNLVKFSEITQNGTRKLTPEEMLKEFGDANLGLHSLQTAEGQSYRTAISEEGKADGIYKRLSDKLIDKLLPNGINDLDLQAPLSQAMKDQIWTSLKTSVLPDAIASLFEISTSQHTINLAMNELLTLLSDELFPEPGNKEEPASPDNLKAPYATSEETKQALKEICGELTEEMLKRYPALINMTVSKKWAGDVLSAQILNFLGTYDFSKLIELSLEKGLPNWHEGRWKKEDGKLESLIPQKVGADGTLSDVKDFEFKWPTNDVERRVEKEKQEKVEQEVKEKLDKLLDQIYDKTARHAVFEAVKSLVKAFLEVVSKCLLFGLIFEGTVDVINDAIAELIVKFLSLPVNLLMYLLKGPWGTFLRAQTDRTTATFNDPIHESFYIHAVDKLLDRI